MDQIPFMRFYSQMLLCFPLAENIKQSEVVADLERSLQTLVRLFPFLNKQVILERDPKSEIVSSGIHKLAPRDNLNEPLLRVKQLAGQFSSYEQISKFKAPASMLDGSVLAPMKSIPDSYDFETPMPVLIVQANFTAGGLLLCFAVMHNAMDGNALGQLIRHFATVCRGENISDADLSAGNLPRSKLFSTLGPDEPSLDHSLIYKEVVDSPSASSDGPAVPAPWTYFRLSATKLAALKAEASRRSSVSAKPSWISTNDAVTALLWRAVLTARSPWLKQESISNLFRAVNGRKSAGVSQNYLGVCVVGAFSQLPVIDLTKHHHISDISALVRETVQEIDPYHLRSFASLLQSEPDKRKISFELPSPDDDVMISSWASLPIYTSDFGARLGKPEIVRRPTFAHLDGLAFIMPQNLEGDIDIAISLKEDDMERLKKDAVWMKYAILIG